MRLYLLTLFIFSIACSSGRNPLYEESNLEIDCYTQKEIPGSEERNINTYLNCRSRKDIIQWDSLSFNGGKYTIGKKVNRIKVELGEYRTELKANQLIVYYKFGSRSYKKTIDKVLKKEDLYLP